MYYETIQIDFNSDEAIYIQLRNQIILGIATSRIQEGDTLPSVRQLADNIHAWELQADGSYVKQHPAEGEAVYDSQEEIGRVLNLMKRRK